MELKTYFTILVRRKWVLLLTTILLLVFVTVLVQILPDVYSSTARLRVKTPVGGSPSYVDFNIWYADRLMNTFAELAMSSSLREELKDKLHLAGNPNISVGVVPSSEMIKITAKAKDPILSAEIANSMAEIIIDHSKGVMEQSGAATLAFLSERQAQVNEELVQAKDKYQQLVNPIAIDSLTRVIDQNNQLYITLKDNYEQNVAKGVDQKVITESEIQMTLLDKKIKADQTELETLNAKVKESLESLDEAKRQISLRESENANLIALLDQARITELIQQNTFTTPVVERAVPPPVKTSRDNLLMYAIGIVVSLMMAITFAFVVDNLDNRLFTNEQILSTTQLPLLGVIPNTQNLNLWEPSDNQGAFWEALRRLRINLSKIAQEKGLKSLVICSAEPREGKSTILASLAIEFALSGKKTVLIDADLRKPTIHQYFQVKNDTGLVDCLVQESESESLEGKGMSKFQDAIHDTAFSNLKVIPSGRIVPRPGELFNSPYLANLLGELKENFNWILIDAPALLAVSDVDELSQNIDAAIFLIQQGRSHESRVKTAVRILNNLRTIPLGVLINRTESIGNYRYYHEKSGVIDWFKKLPKTLNWK
jgi:capsular exopolysaccharide synthesis family protein